ncbi:MAG: hypothetical protein LBH44_04900 [Treponema sp.]|nr:hypothetical protein [Treponema sp.]
MKNKFMAFLFLVFAISVGAQDLIVLKDGSMLEAKVIEISSSEIRYKRINHLDGPTIVLSIADILSIRYENGTVEVMNAAPAVKQGGVQPEAPKLGETPAIAQTSEPSSALQFGLPSMLQQELNKLPAVPIGPNKLKFEFTGDNWIAKLNNRNFLKGDIKFQVTAESIILVLSQTHIYPPKDIPVISAIIKTKWIKTPGPELFLEFKAGPPPSISSIPKPEGLSASLSQDAASQSSRFATLPVRFADTDTDMPIEWGIGGNATVKMNTNKEIINGQSRDVLTVEVNYIRGNHSRSVSVSTDDATIIQKSREGSGIRLNVLGDGAGWRFQFVTKSETEPVIRVSHIKTEKGKVVDVDIPFSQWGNPVYKNNVREFRLVQNDTDVAGNKSTIKIFDIEIY